MSAYNPTSLAVLAN